MCEASSGYLHRSTLCMCWSGQWCDGFDWCLLDRRHSHLLVLLVLPGRTEPRESGRISVRSVLQGHGTLWWYSNVSVSCVTSLAHRQKNTGGDSMSPHLVSVIHTSPMTWSHSFYSLTVSIAPSLPLPTKLEFMHAVATSNQHHEYTSLSGVPGNNCTCFSKTNPSLVSTLTLAVFREFTSPMILVNPTVLPHSNTARADSVA
jgi:hypothetical protein